MALPQIAKDWIEKASAPAKAAALGAALAFSPMAANDAFAQEQVYTAAVTQNDIGKSVQAPTAERPYYIANFDAEAKARDPNASPIDTLYLNTDKLVVLNFIKEGDPASDLQTKVINDTLLAGANGSHYKDLLLINISVADANGNPLYAAAYETYYEQNSLAGPGQSLDTRLAPYGVVFGNDTTNRDGDFQKIADFALMQGVKTQADLNENVGFIQGVIFLPLDRYNRLFDNDPSNDPTTPLITAALD